MLRKKTNVVDPNALIPELPSPADLRPFPTKLGVEYKFHQTPVRAISVSPCGKFLASGDQANNLVIFDVKTSRILRKYQLENDVVDSLEWCPTRYGLIAATNDSCVYLI